MGQYRYPSLSEEKYESPYVVYLLEGHKDFHDILLYYDAAAKLAIAGALWLA
jgi:hypothetical protein